MRKAIAIIAVATAALAAASACVLHRGKRRKRT